MGIAFRNPFPHPPQFDVFESALHFSCGIRNRNAMQIQQICNTTLLQWLFHITLKGKLNLQICSWNSIWRIWECNWIFNEKNVDWFIQWKLFGKWELHEWNQNECKFVTTMAIMCDSWWNRIYDMLISSFLILSVASSASLEKHYG